MYNKQSVTAVLLAGGASQRMGFDKLFYKIDGLPLIWHSVRRFDAHEFIDDIVLVAGQNIVEITELFAKMPTAKPLSVVGGGATRLESVSQGVAASKGEIVAIHDGARPFVSEEIITNAIKAAEKFGAAAPAVAAKDTIKITKDGFVQKTLPRETLVAMQTPQVFKKEKFLAALQQLDPAEYNLVTDDCMVMERAGFEVKIVQGAYENYKITTPEDLAGSKKEGAMFRIGQGYDVHRFTKGRPLIMGGVEIPHDFGLAGHSDADVVLHAVADSLLGALALGDIGKHFPDTKAEFKNADSFVLLCKVSDMVAKKGYRVQNIDVTILCQEPKLAPYIPAMRERIAKGIGTNSEVVSVKATTEEGLGFTGNKEGIAAHCVVLLAKVG